MAIGVIIAKGVFPSYYNTWASLRAAFSPPDPGSQFSVEYPIMAPGAPSFKSAASGSGLIRADRNLISTGLILNFNITATNSQFNPFPPPQFIFDWYLTLDWYNNPANSTNVPAELQTQLIGETVTLSLGAPFTITSSLFTTTNGRQYFLYGSGVPQGAVTGVGKLTPIT